MYKIKFAIGGLKTCQNKKTSWFKNINFLTFTAAVGTRAPINYLSGEPYCHLGPKSLEEFLVNFCLWLRALLCLAKHIKQLKVFEKCHRGSSCDVYHFKTKTEMRESRSMTCFM